MKISNFQQDFELDVMDESYKNRQKLDFYDEDHFDSSPVELHSFINHSAHEKESNKALLLRQQSQNVFAM